MLAKPVGETGNGGGGAEDYILIREEQSSGVNGGTFTSGAWRTRPLNTEVEDTGNNASIASNQITLAAGTYRTQGWASTFSVGRHKAKLRNISDNTDTIIGSSELNSNNVTRSKIEGRFTIASSKVFEIQHRCQTTQASIGMGVSCDFGVLEVYLAIEFWKEA